MAWSLSKLMQISIGTPDFVLDFFCQSLVLDLFALDHVLPVAGLVYINIYHLVKQYNFIWLLHPLYNGFFFVFI